MEVHPYSVKLQWTELLDYVDNGGDKPFYYMLEWKNYNTTQWETLTTEANGLRLDYTHEVTGVVFLNTTNLMYRLTAKNGVGLAESKSLELIVPPCTAPLGMDNLFLTKVEPYGITFGWPSLSASLNGGD